MMEEADGEKQLAASLNWWRTLRGARGRDKTPYHHYCGKNTIGIPPPPLGDRKSFWCLSSWEKEYLEKKEKNVNLAAAGSFLVLEVFVNYRPSLLFLNLNVSQTSKTGGGCPYFHRNISFSWSCNQGTPVISATKDFLVWEVFFNYFTYTLVLNSKCVSNKQDGFVSSLS